ncbi:MAG TPA: hypothetical protein VMU46_10700 [Burkholderiales bacterium]|nr:hypothetical protein [Burkholderiales bacterium]
MVRLTIVTLCMLAAVIAGVPQFALGQDKPALAANPRGVYASINLRPAQDMINRLSAPYGSDKRIAIREVLGRPTAVMPPVLYALANTLAEDHPEEAIFWYHVGRIRAVYDALRCRDKTAQAGVLALRQQIGKELRDAQFYRRDRVLRIAKKAIEWDAENARSYDERWISLYGKVAASSDGSDSGILVPEAEWPAILKHVHEAHLAAVEQFVAEKK